MATGKNWVDTLIGRLLRHNGNEITQRSQLNFGAGFTVTDDPANDRTTIAAAGVATSVAEPDIAALRALDSTDLVDTEVAIVASPGSTWVYSSTTGAGLVDDGATIVKPHDLLTSQNGRWFNANTSTVLPTIAALRLATAGVQSAIQVQNYRSVGDGGGDIFDYDPSDTTSADNLGTIIVAGTRRYKRRMPGHKFHPEWFGLKADLDVLTGLAINSGDDFFTKAGLVSPVGKKVIFEGAGAAGGQLVATITAYASNVVRLSVAASTTVASGGKAFIATDDTAAVQALIDAVFAARTPIASSYDGEGLTSICQPTVQFGHKPFAVFSPLVSPGGIHYLGAPSVIHAPKGVDILTGFHYGDAAEYIDFHGGGYGIFVETGNTDTTTLRINNCNFFGQSTAAFGDDGASQSTHLWSYGCKFYDLPATSKIVYQKTGDGWHIVQAWVSAGCDAVFQCGDLDSEENPRMYIDGLLTVPASTTGSWVKWYAGSVVIENMRFGGEAGGMGYIVDCHASLQSAFPAVPRALVMRQCAMFANSKMVRFFALPNLVQIDGCTGMVSSPTQGMYLDSSIPDADRRAFATYGKIVVDNVMQPLCNFDSASDQEAANVLLANKHCGPRSASINVEDRILSFPANYSGSGLNTTGSHMETPGNGTDSFGNPTVTFESNLAGATQIWFWSTALTTEITVPTGVYTARFMIKVKDNPVKVRMIAGDVNRFFEIPYTGTGFVPYYVTFYYDTDRSSDTGLGFQFFDLADNTTFEVEGVTLYKGAIEGSNEEWETILASATPTHSNFKPFPKGTILVNRAPALGNAFWWRNNTAGTKAGGAESWEPIISIDPNLEWPGTDFLLLKTQHVKIGTDGQLPTAGTIRIARIDDINAALIATRNHAATQNMRWFFADTSDFQYVFDFVNTGGSVVNSSADYYFQVGISQSTVLHYDSTLGQWLFPNGNGITDPAISFINYPNTGMALVSADCVALVANNSKAFEWDFSSGAVHLAFYGGTKRAQAARPGQLSGSIGTPGSSLTAVSGTGDDTHINDNLASLQAKVNAIEAALSAAGGGVGITA